MRSQARGDASRAKVYESVSSRWIKNKTAPTIREIAAETGMSVATAHRHVQILIEQGHLQGRGRTLRPSAVS